MIGSRCARSLGLFLVLLVFLGLTGCGGSAKLGQVLNIGAIPDQDVAVLNRQFGGVAAYLEKELGVPVKYVPVADYAAVVTAFQRGDIDLAWFGGLTAVQAMAVSPGSEVVAQRPRDAEFHSVFVVGPGVTAKELTDLKGLTFTFGSESSTSGHLMPRYFLMQAGIDPDKDFKVPPNFSGSHDKTYKLVEAGAFQAGALNEQVWERATKEGTVDTGKVKVIHVTPSYHDYNWTLRAGSDEKFGKGTRERVIKALLEMGVKEPGAMKLFGSDKFVPTQNSNYDAIRQVAEKIGIIKQ